nr:MAG TPA: hypothetical protein [Caudoviricetes sp.]
MAQAVPKIRTSYKVILNNWIFYQQKQWGRNCHMQNIA